MMEERAHVTSSYFRGLFELLVFWLVWKVEWEENISLSGRASSWILGCSCSEYVSVPNGSARSRDIRCSMTEDGIPEMRCR
jgi:hypothetical protein